MDIDAVFNNIITELKDGKRPLVKLSEADLKHLSEKWSSINNTKNWDELFKILCILDNTTSLSSLFTEEINRTLTESKDAQTLVLVLGVARKHIIDESHKRGERIKMDFINVLKSFLGHDNPEVLEWTLRLIEGLGSQSIILKNDVLNAKPGFMAIFNEHKKAAKQIIELLEKRWTR